MITREFWTNKRIEALGKAAMTLFQAFVIAGALGGFFGKIEGFWPRTAFIVATFALFIVGIILSDNPFRNKKEE